MVPWLVGFLALDFVDVDLAGLDFVDVDLVEVGLVDIDFVEVSLVGAAFVEFDGALTPGAEGAAIASIRGAVFFAGIVARTCLMALVCSSSVIRNS